MPPCTLACPLRSCLRRNLSEGSEMTERSRISCPAVDEGARPGQSADTSPGWAGQPKKTSNKLLRLLKHFGPGVVTGASDDDPSGIGTYAIAGASFGYATLWTALFTFPLMAAVQFTCAKVGLVTGMGLAGVIRRHYPRAILYAVVVALVLANSLNAGADIGAIAAAVNLLVPLPATALIVPIALLILAVQIWGSYRLIARTFQWLTLALFAYVGAAF